jgi:hypothetical protein
MEFISIDADGITSVFDLSIPQPPGRTPRDNNTTKEERQARCTRKLFRLLTEREDLRGVYAPADQIAETLRWSA